jgi:hypothetical protein
VTFLAGQPMIDVDDVGAGRLGDRGRLRRIHSRLAPGELHHMRAARRIPRPLLERSSASSSPCDERGAGNHLRDDKPGAKFLGELAEWAIGNPGHWREESAIGQRMAANADAASKLRHELHQK